MGFVSFVLLSLLGKFGGGRQGKGWEKVVKNRVPLCLFIWAKPEAEIYCTSLMNKLCSMLFSFLKLVEVQAICKIFTYISAE